MEQLIDAFGIDARAIVIQIFNFVVLAGALTYFLYNPVLTLLKDREEKIAQGLKDAEAAAAAKEAADAEKKAILTAAETEAAAVGARAKAHADTQANEIVAAAQTKATTVLKSAEASAEELKAKAKKESDAEIAKVAVLAAETILRERRS